MYSQYIVLPRNLSYSSVFSVRPAPVTTLWYMLASVPDPRRKQGRRHGLPTMLTLAILALCSGHTSYLAMREWCENYQEQLEQFVPFLSGHTPNEATFHRIFARIDEKALEDVFGEWIQHITPVAQGEGIALDGKEIHGTGVCLVAAFAHIAKSVLFEQGIPTKGKELVVGPQVLKHITIQDHVITGDALFTQKTLCELITTRQGGYVFRVKGNQEHLAKDIQLYFADLPFGAHVQTHTTVTRWKGQIEERTITVSSELNDYLNWPGLTHVWQMKKTVIRNKTTRTEVSVGIARIHREMIGKQSEAQAVAAYIRGHWGIETRLHRTRDMVFHEDHSGIRKGNAPNVMAALRNVVLSLFHRATVRNFKTAQRRFAAHPDELFTFLGLTNIAKQYC